VAVPNRQTQSFTLTKRDLQRVTSHIRPLILETTAQLISQGFLSGEDFAVTAYPLPHAETHERLGGDPLFTEDIWLICVNRSGAPIPAHKAVYVSGVGVDEEFGNRQRPAIDLADNADPSKLPPVGVTLEEMPDGGEGRIIRLGQIGQVDVTTPNWLNGEELYLDGTTPGDLTNVPPRAPVFRIGTVIANEAEGGSGVEPGEPGGELLVDIEDVTDLVGTPIAKLLNHVTVAVNYVVASGIDLVLVDATTGPVTVTLPTTLPNDGRVIRVKKIDLGSAASNRVFIDSAGGELVEDVLSFELKKFGEVLELASDGTQWWVAG
jgi:hypothetical protein